MAKSVWFDLSVKFNSAHFSTSVFKCGRRWPISLSSWFKEYVHIPMGGSRTKSVRNTFITFACSGMWHGANFTYLIWGLINGLLVYVHKIFSKRAFKLPGIVKIIFTFIVIDFCWIFFRAASFNDAFYVITNSFVNLSFQSLKTVGVERHLWLIAIMMLVFMLTVEWITKEISVIGWWHTTRRRNRIVFLNVLLFLMLFFGVFEHRTFIYFQF